jgi:hypothetical protein
MIFVVPVSLLAAGLNTAMAHPYGASWLNGASVEHASAIFPGDTVQTDPGAILKIDASGSTVTVLSDSLVKFEGDFASVERGSAKLKTSNSMSAHAGIVTVTPVSSTPTEYQVASAEGIVKVTAIKGSLNLNNGAETTTLKQGQEATQTGASLNPNIKRAGAAVIGGKALAFSIAAATATGTVPVVTAVEASGKKGSVKLP